MDAALRTILVAVDLDAPDPESGPLPAAALLARSLGARLTLCAVVPAARAAEAQWSPFALREMMEVARARLGSLADRLDGLDCGIEVCSGGIAQGIVEAAGRIGADLVVVGARRSRARDWLAGGKPERVVGNAPCSVLVVRDRAPA